MISQCRPPRPTTFLTTHYRPTNMDFVGFSLFIHALLGVPILNLQSFLYPSEPTKFSIAILNLQSFLDELSCGLFTRNFHKGTSRAIAHVLVIFSLKPEWFSYVSYTMVMNINSG